MVMYNICLDTSCIQECMTMLMIENPINVYC